MEYRYILASNKVKKINCPYCGGKRYWQRYIDTETGDVLPEEFGRCDSENKCGQHSQPPLETLCYFVPIDSIKSVTEKATSISQNGVEQMLPKKVILEQSDSGIYVADYFLKDKDGIRGTPLKITFDSNDRKYFADGNISFQPKTKQPRPAPPPTVFFDYDTFVQTLAPERYEQNTFIQNLLHNVKYPFGVEDISKVIALYHLGTVANGYRAGAITFPFIDINGNIRAVQAKQFDKDNHTVSTDFLHKVVEDHYTRNNEPLPEWLKAYNQNAGIVKCLFGEKLLSRYPNAIIHLFESPKAAIYFTLYFGFPEQSNIICLGVYNKSCFTFDRLKILQGRVVVVYPDLSKDGSTYAEWETKAKDYESQLPDTHFIFSDLLEQSAEEDERKKGDDFADYLTSKDWRVFRNNEDPAPVAIEVPTQYEEVEDFNTYTNLEAFYHIESIANRAFGQVQHSTLLDTMFYPSKTALKKEDIIKSISKAGSGSADAIFERMVSFGIIEQTANPYLYRLTGNVMF